MKENGKGAERLKRSRIKSEQRRAKSVFEKRKSQRKTVAAAATTAASAAA